MSILKKSARGEPRIPVKAGTCIIQGAGPAAHPVVVQMHDISHGGLSFISSEPFLTPKQEIQIQFLNVRPRPILMNGRIAAQSPYYEKQHRYSVRFNEALNDEKLTLLLMAMPILKQVG